MLSHINGISSLMQLLNDVLGGPLFRPYVGAVCFQWWTLNVNKSDIAMLFLYDTSVLVGLFLNSHV